VVNQMSAIDMQCHAMDYR